MLQGKKAITSREMQRIEALAYAEGHTAEEFMDKAGAGIAQAVERFTKGLQRHVYLLIGKGNNGGDAYAAAIVLLARGFSITAFHLFSKESGSPLNQSKLAQFQKKGGQVLFMHESEELPFAEEGVILDGLVGTGFRGRAEGVLASAIAQANGSGLPILAIDIPSGVDGTTGAVGSVAIRATETLYLGLPKLGFFVGKGWDYVGDLVEIDFGLPKEIAMQAEAALYLLAEEQLVLPPMRKSRHKYEAGYVLGIGGSRAMGGAAALASQATLRAGAGIVRLFHGRGMETALLPLEVICEELDVRRVREEERRAKAVFVGPGLGRTGEVRRALRKVVPELTLPTVVDADALYFLAEGEYTLPKRAMVTPHRGEMARLLGGEEPNLGNCQAYADRHHVTLVLKGGPTMIFHPHTLPIVVPRGDPGMATAGSGDVLAGILVALLAQGADLQTAAVLGVFLHACAGEAAALEKSSYCMIASDLIAALPQVFLCQLTKRSRPSSNEVCGRKPKIA